MPLSRDGLEQFMVIIIGIISVCIHDKCDRRTYLYVCT